MISDTPTQTENRQYAIRHCTTLDDYAECLRMQQQVWQFSDLDTMPLRSLVINRRCGGFTLGSFDDTGRMVGFAHALAAFNEKGRAFFYSQMLAVSAELQNAGIGAKLKLAQRDYARERGIPLMTWTFDPLQSRNAWLNLSKLGGVVRTCYVNYYGNSSSSVLHQGLDSDRLFVEWWVTSDHVARALGGERRRDEPVATVEVPYGIDEIKQRDMAEARDWQLQIRAAFQQHLNAGLYCAGFERDADGGNGRYLFFRDERREVAEGY